MEAYLDFEKPIINLEKKLQDLKDLASQEGIDFNNEILILERKISDLVESTYAKLTPWQRVQLSRHPNRPYTQDYIDLLFTDFVEIHGDRAFSDDPAVIAGVATWAHSSTSVLIIGNQKGRTTKKKMERNFGMAKPEGYRKAMRIMQLAKRFQIPLLTFIDTPGAYPGIEAEERGQSQAIAESIQLMFQLPIPIISVVIGEGGSGGALAIGVANRVLMQEFSTYSVISPESCASILWSDSTLSERASEKLKMSASELLKLGVIDLIVDEPSGGAHRNWQAAADLLRSALSSQFESLIKVWKKSPQKLITERQSKFRMMGKDLFVDASLSV